MKFFTIIIVLLSTLNLYSQGDLTLKLLLFPADFSGNETIFFGVDSTATDGIDPWLGESNLPPDFCAPWGASFCAFLRLPPFNGTILSYKDFRFGELPYTGQITHRVEVINYASTGNDSVHIRYNLPDGVNIHFTDQLGGIFINFTIQDSGETAYLYQSDLRKLWMYVNYNSVVPVEITSFTWRIKNGNSVVLNWSTSTETNNSGFQIERRKIQDGKSNEWNSIGFVIGNGTTTEPQFYSFVDINSSSGKYKYRLKQIDFDGNYKYSNEIEVVVDLAPKEFVLHQNYPNPFNPTTKIKFTIPVVETRHASSQHAVSLKVYDILGTEVATLVNENKPAGTYEVEFDASDLPSGVYLYKLSAGNFISIKKMMLIK